MADGSAALPTSRRVDAEVAARSMLNHPFYRAWSAGELSLDTLRTYARQYYHHVEAFPRAVSAVHSMCPDRDGRWMLAENLAEEEGIGEGRDDHASLWMMFAEGLGETSRAVEAEDLEPETRSLIDTFSSLSRQSYPAGLGALYAYESQLPEVARAKIDGLKAFYGISDEPTLRFFNVHEGADVQHAAVCRGLLDALPPEQADEAVAAGAALSQALLDFLSGVERRVGRAN